MTHPLDGHFSVEDSARRIVACARIGQQRVVKLRLDGRDAVLTLVVRWAPRADGWRAQALEVARLDAARPA